MTAFILLSISIDNTFLSLVIQDFALYTVLVIKIIVCMIIILIIVIIPSKFPSLFLHFILLTSNRCVIIIMVLLFLSFLYDYNSISLLSAIPNSAYFFCKLKGQFKGTDQTYIIYKLIIILFLHIFDIPYTLSFIFPP